jgi:hypothetical protein
MNPILFMIKLTFLVCILGSSRLAGQTQMSTDDLNQLWLSRNYEQIKVALEQNLNAESPDLALLHCTNTFFVLVQPDKQKAVSAAQKLKLLVDAGGDVILKDLAKTCLDETGEIPADEFSPLPEDWLNTLHLEFPASFPNLHISLGFRPLTTQ